MSEKLSETETPDWDVAVACSINLGQLFRENPDLEGKYLDINPAAIREIIYGFEPPRDARLCFTAVHDNNLSLGVYGETRKYISNTHPDKDNFISIDIAIGGGFISAIDKLISEHKESEKFIQTKDNKKAGQMESAIHHEVYDAKTFKIADVLINDLVADDNRIQTTTVHELKHAADYTDTKMLMKEKRHKLATMTKIIIGGEILFVGVSLGAQRASEELFNIQDRLTLVALGLLPVFGVMKIIRKTGQNYIERRKLKSPLEKSARATHQIANQKPRVITIRSTDQPASH